MELQEIKDKLKYLGERLYQKYGSGEYEARTIVYDSKAFIESQAKEIEQLKEVSDENDRLVDELLKFKAVKRENTKLKEQVKELEIICSELVKLPKGIESHSYSDYLKNK